MSEMKTYFVSDKNDPANTRTALGRMIEYAKFLEKESGRENESFVDSILQEEEIEVSTERTEILHPITDIDKDTLVEIIKEIFGISMNGGTITVSDIAGILKKNYKIDLNSI